MQVCQTVAVLCERRWHPDRIVDGQARRTSGTAGYSQAAPSVGARNGSSRTPAGARRVRASPARSRGGLRRGQAGFFSGLLDQIGKPELCFWGERPKSDDLHLHCCARRPCCWQSAPENNCTTIAGCTVATGFRSRNRKIIWEWWCCFDPSQRLCATSLLPSRWPRCRSRAVSARRISLVAVKHRGSWFYVDDRDHVYKRFFNGI
jgi:hypothetical protein